MRRKVELSTYCWIISALSTALMCGIFVYALKQSDHTWPVVVLAVLIVGLMLSTLFYMPLSVSVDDRNLNVSRSLRVKTIPLTDIADVKLCPPTMAARRICGSGGWFGWYGWFRERDLGRYFAYYGKASDCFLVTLKDGRKYMLGCADAPAMVAAIRSRLR